MTIALPSPDLLQAPAEEGVDFDRRVTGTGDGYARFSPTGINNTRTNYTITWVPQTPADSDAIRDVLIATQGTETITWTPPNESTSRNWVCNTVKSRYTSPNTKQVTAQLTEKFLS